MSKTLEIHRGIITCILHLNASDMNFQKYFLPESTFIVKSLIFLMGVGKQNFPLLRHEVMQDYSSV